MSTFRFGTRNKPEAMRIQSADYIDRYLVSVYMMGMFEIELYGDPRRTRVTENVALKEGSSKHGNARLASVR